MKRGKDKAVWGLDALMDNLLITEEQFSTPPQRPRPRSYSTAPPRTSPTSPTTPTSPSSNIHRISATPLSHNNSIASSASTRSTQSRHSTFSSSSNSTDTTLPVTVFEVPHSYDENPSHTQGTSSKPVITLSPKVYVDQPHFTVATFGKTDIANWLFDHIQSDRENRWQVDSATSLLTFSPFTSKSKLLDLGERLGISTFLVIASSLEMFYKQLDLIDNCTQSVDPDKLWWRRLVLIVDQEVSSNEIMKHREHILHDQLPQILERYGMSHTPAVMFVCSASGKHYQEYTLQCKQVLRQLIDSSHRLGRWRPDEDEDDFLDAAVIHLSPQGKMPVRSMTKYNK